mmetsp:Transcript_12918/g.31667  ORF Transcript_12918/g.31667 Transcript_12918/m.31667 type:complete len:515 (-) Transcript_12918:174-1718(-)|eukprot:CAMPEP_0114522288 /NCGR_PEP_ID=MMETSP0109-20121206/20662_1 /TAXON_ID=29199 /ORGANISM="Chlorarachnion reptans, Strain CCCM449" /LENGTH=514 /DNA_ID=CAMNT_0001703495 /DNA_START=139 /DNA_END=1683 /DNA_ORIENTATION=-
MLLKELAERRLADVPRDEDPENFNNDGEGAGVIFNSGKDIYQGLESLGPRRAHVLGDMGAFYSGKVVPRSGLTDRIEDVANQQIEDHEDDDKEADQSEDFQEDRELNYPGTSDGESEVKEGQEDQENGFQAFAGLQEKQEAGDSGEFGSGRHLAKSLDKMMEQMQEDESIILREQTRGHHDKAKSVRAQYQLWENIMKLRIRLQPVLSLANSLPTPTDYKIFCKGAPKLDQAFEKAANTTFGTLKSLINLSESLMGSSKLFKAQLKKSCVGKETPLPRKRKIISSEVTKLWKSVETDFDRQADIAAHGIERWATKTALASGKRMTKGKRFKVLSRTISDQVDDALQDLPSLVKRTQLRRSKARIFKIDLRKPGESDGTAASDAEYDEEIFDDADFYHEQLREVVAGQESSSLGFSKRQAKKAKKVKSVRGTKGRVIRTDNVEKLTNFMAPKASIDEDCPRDMLFQSLFGQHAPDSIDVNTSSLLATADGDHSVVQEGGDGHLKMEDQIQGFTPK